MSQGSATEIAAHARREIIAEARGWVYDSFDDAPARLSRVEIVNAVMRHYVGGWAQFVQDVTA